MFWVLLFFTSPSSLLLCTLVPEVIMFVLRGAAVNQLLYPAARAPQSSDGLSVVVATVSTHSRDRYQAAASLISLYQHSLKARSLSSSEDKRHAGHTNTAAPITKHKRIQETQEHIFIFYLFKLANQ